MQKLSLIVIAGLVSLSLAAAAGPSFAASIASCDNEISDSGNHGAGQYSAFIDQDSTAIMAALKAKGINAADISNWGGCVKADVVRKNGQTAMEFFDPDTLQRLHVNGG